GARADLISFDRIDTNGDGFITREEDAAFRRRVQSQRPATPARLTESVQLVADVPYAGTDNPRQRLDLLAPKRPTADRPTPVIVFTHGGAWRGGDRLVGHAALAPYVSSGEYAGVTVGYRLTDRATWPAQIHDCKAAVRWVRANAAKYRLDPDRIGVIGGAGRRPPPPPPRTPGGR